MKYTCSLICEYCNSPTQYCIIDQNKIISLCWIHKVEIQKRDYCRIDYIVRCENQLIGRLDRGYASGLCVCEECNKKYYDHPVDVDHSYLHVLCDGSVVKL